MTAPRCRLRPLEPGDLDVLFCHQADARANQLAGVPPRDREAYDQHWARLTENPRVTIRVVVAADGADHDQVAGYVFVFDRNDERELGYWLGHDFWGRGIATTALGLFLAEITERPLAAHVVVHNAASAKVLLRNGFAEVGQHAADDGTAVRDFLLS